MKKKISIPILTFLICIQFNNLAYAEGEVFNFIFGFLKFSFFFIFISSIVLLGFSIFILIMLGRLLKWLRRKRDEVPY